MTRRNKEIQRRWPDLHSILYSFYRELPAGEESMPAVGQNSFENPSTDELYTVGLSFCQAVIHSRRYWVSRLEDDYRKPNLRREQMKNFMFGIYDYMATHFQHETGEVLICDEARDREKESLSSPTIEDKIYTLIGGSKGLSRLSLEQIGRAVLKGAWQHRVRKKYLDARMDTFIEYQKIMQQLETLR